MLPLAGAGLKGVLLAFASILFPLEKEGPPRLYNPHRGYYPGTHSPCMDYRGNPGLCKAPLECTGILKPAEDHITSPCLLSPHSRGVCCLLKEKIYLRDPLKYIGRVLTENKNRLINFQYLTSISSDDLNTASESAISQMEIREGLERNLVQRKIVIPRGSAAFWHARLLDTSEGISSLGHHGAVVLQASINLVERFTIQPEDVYNQLTQYSVSGTIIKDSCPPPPSCPVARANYRSHDGTCNNLLRTEWGSAGSTMRRLLIPHYHDGVSLPRRSRRGGSPLPSARRVSSLLHPHRPTSYLNFTLLVMQWGQFLDHDITHTPIAKGAAFTDVSCCQGGHYLPEEDLHPECLPILVPANDSFFSHHDQGCLEFVRSMPGVNPLCSFGPREQINQVTSFIDGSAIYGSSEAEAKELRSFREGKMKMSHIYGNQLLPPNPMECQSEDERTSCFQAGDRRVNEQPHLAAMHTVWVRHHNQIATKLSRLNPRWSDQRLYEESRRIVAAQIQHITYNEFLPILLGAKFVAETRLAPAHRHFFHGYNSTVDPTILNAFSSAAFRFGHSLVTDHFRLFSKEGRESHLQLQSVQFAPYSLYHPDGLESLMRGLIRQHPQTSDRFFVDQLTAKLFAFKAPFGLDLVALNIQRGRDHGIPPYVAWRIYCGLKPVSSWTDLIHDMDENAISALQSAYEAIEDVDLFVGGVSERHLDDSIVGPTFHCILSSQFIRLKIGDRFFYENGPDVDLSHPITSFTPEQLQQIRKTTFARILCANAKNIGKIQPLTFLAPSPINQKVACNERDLIPFINLVPWKTDKQPTN